MICCRTLARSLVDSTYADESVIDAPKPIIVW